MASIRKRPDGVWRARYRDAAGKEHARHFARKVDGQRWLDEVTASIVTGQYVDPKAGRITFSDWFATWLDRQVWVPGTRESAQQAADSVTFGDLPLKAIRKSHVEAWVKFMTQPAESRKSGLAPSTIRTRFSHVSSAFLAAVRDRVIAISPADGVALPRMRRAEAAMSIPTPKQVGEAIEAADSWFRTFVMVCAFAGMRLGEAAALRLVDVDVDVGTIRVARQIQGSNAETASIVLPKNGSERTISAPAGLILAIEQHAEDIGVWGSQGYLFGAGYLVHRGTAGHQWRRLRAKVGLEAFTLHDLRHFYASGLIASGCDVVTVQRALGHTKPSITLNVYSHLWPSADDRTRKAAAELMREATAPGGLAIRASE